MIRIVVDMNLSPAWVDLLSSAGYTVVHWSRVGAPDASDRVVVAWAFANDHAVMTNDLDFAAILAATQLRKPSVIQIRGDLLTPEAIGAVVLDALAATKNEIEAGAVVSIDTQRTRVRILPLRP